MSQQPGSVDLDQLKHDFVAYLNGGVAPLFAAEMLSQVLRVEPPVYFDPRQIAELVHTWAQIRAAQEYRPIHEFYLKSIELIVTADRTGVLSAFKPSAFYMPYFEGLVRNCPAQEKAEFRDKLKQLREVLFREWGYNFSRAEFEVTATVVSEGVTRAPQPQDEILPLINKIRTTALRLTPIEQQQLINDLHRVLWALVGIPEVKLTPYLESIIDCAITIFNAGHPLFGAELLYIAQQVYWWEGFDPIARDGLRQFKHAAALDEAQLKLLAGKPELKAALRVIITHFDELSPYALLNMLAHEGDRQQRRFLISLIEAHEEAAAPVIISMLSQIAADAQNWYFVRNLIYLLGRVAPKDYESQYAAINLISPYLRAPIFQLRIAAIASLESFTVDEVLTPVMEVFNDANYTEEQLNNQERISTYLSNTIALIGKLNSEAAVRLLVEIAVGRHIDFISEKLTRTLRLQALQLLQTKRALLSPPLLLPVVDRIRSMTSRWKIKFVSRLLGEDEQQLLALMEVAACAPSAEVVELLTDIKARYSKEISGRRAGELLNQLQLT